ncbi:hypothetical protein [Dyadobacter sandarakinus]|uniref:Uncharacterized protein n=1 Tax=Dyadobacter sandarakinus TaxID=2747268 RepID=A0ABX7IDA6_9BACT|nr:hypothetical protein [Dyadobacter sandarakinus]QRR03914.1 hypothetical protein HWI92_24875 [Dyadobacter sandarakinus]
MDNKDDARKNPGIPEGKADPRPLEERLQDYVNEKETDENLEKLGKALAAEWTEQSTEDAPTDLSFSKLDPKSRKSRRQ